ncbi:MAG: PTS galactosamine transporter subunit IIB [Erysipelotrichaceae bacterium]
MEQAKIVLTRVDNRLVHGQVGSTWTNSIGVDTIVVVDDDVANNVLQQKLMITIAHAASVKIRFYSIDDFVHVFNTTSSHQKLFLVVENPNVARKIVEKGIVLKDVNLGNLHYSRGKVAISRKAYLDEEDIDSINYLLSKKINVYYQDVPGTAIETIAHLDYETLKKRR